MNIVYAVKIFTALTLIMLAMRATLSKGLLEVTTASDLMAAWKAILGTLIVSCFSWRTPVFFVTLSLWALYVPRLFGSTERGRLPAYAVLVCICPQFTMELENVGPVQDVMRLDAFRIIEIFILLPEAWRLIARRETVRSPSWLRFCDFTTYGYAFYWTLHLYGGMNISSLARESVGMLLGGILPYFVFSRACVQGEMRRRVLSMFLVGAAYESLVSIIEALSRHRLYGQLQYLYETQWGFLPALMRGSFLRAQAGLSSALAMAVLALFAIGLWFALRPLVKTRAYALVGLSLFGGLLATFSRGPILALLILVSGLAGLRIVSERKLLGLGLFLAVALSGLWNHGLGDLVVGLINRASTDETADFNIRYRQELLSTSLALIQQSPWFGVPNYLGSLQELRQGEGIIDLVNTYLVIALNVGVTGLIGFLLPYAVVLWKQSSLLKNESPESHREGRAWNPLILAILAAAFTVSPVSIIHYILIWIVAIAAARLQDVSLAQGRSVLMSPRLA